MRRWAAAGIGVGLIGSLLASFAAAQISKPRKTAAPAITAAMKSRATARVDQYLAESAGAALEHPGALAPVFEMLFRLNTSQSHDPVHILHFGDSHTAADEWTGGLREQFQARFGNGGSGFSVAGRPFLGYRRFDAPAGATPLWHTEGGRAANGDGYFGLGGVSIVTSSPGQSIYLQTECQRLEVHYLQQPGGGSVELLDNGQRLQEFSTDGFLMPAVMTFDVSPGPHRFTLVTRSARPVRLFGWVADRDDGVTYEALGLNGAEATVMLKWNEAMLDTYLQRRNPGMIVLAYGANEASDPGLIGRFDTYQAMFVELLQRLRKASPTASILVVGPADRWARSRGTWQEVPGVDDIIAAQRAACREQGCAFWDTRQRMGGKGSMLEWVTAGLAQADHVHFTVAGYRRLANALFDDLTGQYDTFKKVRQEMVDRNSHGQANQDH